MRNYTVTEKCLLFLLSKKIFHLLSAPLQKLINYQLTQLSVSTDFFFSISVKYLKQSKKIKTFGARSF